MINSNESAAARQLRISRRWLFALLLLVIPYTVVASKPSDLLHSDLVFGITETVFMLGFIAVAIWSYVAHLKVTGKYPFHWLFRK